MGHHGSGPFDDEHPDREALRKFIDGERATANNEKLAKLLDTASFRGAVGDFPMGKLSASDEGAIQFGVTVKDGKVVLDFGTPVQWIGMSAQQAAELASTLLMRAREAGRRTGETVTMVIGK